METFQTVKLAFFLIVELDFSGKQKQIIGKLILFTDFIFSCNFSIILKKSQMFDEKKNPRKKNKISLKCLCQKTHI